MLATSRHSSSSHTARQRKNIPRKKKSRMRVRDDFDGRKREGEDWHQSQEEGEWLVQHGARSLEKRGLRQSSIFDGKRMIIRESKVFHDGFCD